jgi:hypothetical protein
MELKTIINWNGLSILLAGKQKVIRSNRDIKKYSKVTESLKKHILAWAKENNIDLK